MVSKYYGGFFNIEKPSQKLCYHSNLVLLSNGRACISLIIKKLKIKKIYLPHYCCEEIKKLFYIKKIKIIFYKINEKLEIDDEFNIQKDDYILWINYFNLKKEYFNKILKKKYKHNIILDNTHSFFEKENKSQIYFCSARKFFGVPDGAYVNIPNLNIKINNKTNPNLRFDHLYAEYENKKDRYEKFIKNEKKFSNQIYTANEYSKYLLKSINYELAAKQRIKNYHTAHNLLGKINKCKFSLKIKQNCVPFCYPLVLKKNIRKILWKNNIFIPYFWKNINKKAKIENLLLNNLHPIPIDQRYNEKEIYKICNIILRIK